MNPLDEIVYVDSNGRFFLDSRDFGYEEYGYIKDNGTLGITGRFVAPAPSWKVVSSELQTKEHKDFLDRIKSLLVVK